MIYLYMWKPSIIAMRALSSSLALSVEYIFSILHPQCEVCRINPLETELL